MMLTLDANFRTFTAVAKTVGSANPGVILLGTPCSMQYIAEGQSFDVTIGSISVNSGDIAAFTSSTLAIFMIKLAIRKRSSKSGNALLDSTTIHCVMLKARLKLIPRRVRPRRKEQAVIPALQAALDTLSRDPRQPIKLHGFAGFTIDARRTLVSGLLVCVERLPGLILLAI
jgi:hypothetical protein